MTVVSTRKIKDLNERQKKILEQARIQGMVQVEQLSQDFSVVPQTIRRDLSLLCKLRLLQRVHGGAIAHDGVSNLGYEARCSLGQHEKEAISKRAAELIPDDCSMFLAIGTTTEQVARKLVDHIGMLVITNNINIVDILRHSKGIEVITAGGVVRKEDGGIVGGTTVDFIQQFKVDFAVISASAVEEDGAILDFDPREVIVSQAIIENSRSVILVADSTKLERSAPIRIADISQVDYFVTDKNPSQKFQKLCEKFGVALVIASDKKVYSKKEKSATAI